MESARIAIIGGGPGGLMTAHLLRKRAAEVNGRPLEITLFEASHRLGGKIRSGQFEAAPVLYEAGAAELYDYSAAGPDPLAEFVESVGLKRRELFGRTVMLGDRLLRTDADIRDQLGEATVRGVESIHAPGPAGDFTSRLLRVGLESGQSGPAGEADLC
jgi:phytoene dehydrogenase-like protein